MCCWLPTPALGLLPVSLVHSTPRNANQRVIAVYCTFTTMRECSVLLVALGNLLHVRLAWKTLPLPFPETSAERWRMLACSLAWPQH